MMNFFWPDTLRLESTPMIRAGRVAHWTGLVLGAPWLLALLALTGQDEPYVALAALIGLIPAQLGRGVRYIMAGE